MFPFAIEKFVGKHVSLVFSAIAFLCLKQNSITL